MEQLAATLPAEEAAAQRKDKSPAQGPAAVPRPPSRRSSARLKVSIPYAFLCAALLSMRPAVCSPPLTKLQTHTFDKVR